MLTLKKNTWIVSDTHFFHKNIVKYANRPLHHNELMEKNWRELVKPDDQVLHLGDVHVWYENEPGVLNQAQELIKSLPGHKHLLKGNHDKFDLQWYLDCGFETVIADDIRTVVGDAVILLTHAPDITLLDWDINIHGHIHINGYPPECSPKRDYRNVSIEVMNYRPWRLEDILNGEYRGIKEQGFDTHKLAKRRR